MSNKVNFNNLSSFKSTVSLPSWRDVNWTATAARWSRAAAGGGGGGPARVRLARLWHSSDLETEVRDDEETVDRRHSSRIHAHT